MKKYIFARRDAAILPDDKLIIAWEDDPTHGLILTLSFNSTAKTEKTAYKNFVSACRQAVEENVLPKKMYHWNDWADIKAGRCKRQYSHISTAYDSKTPHYIFWRSTFVKNFYTEYGFHGWN